MKTFRQAVFLDMFGNQVRTYQGNNFNVENIKEGIYIFKIQVKNELITHLRKPLLLFTGNS